MICYSGSQFRGSRFKVKLMKERLGTKENVLLPA